MAAFNSSSGWDVPSGSGSGGSDGNHAKWLIIIIAVIAFLSGIFIAVAVFSGLSGRKNHSSTNETPPAQTSSNETSPSAEAQGETQAAMQTEPQTEAQNGIQIEMPSAEQTAAQTEMQTEAHTAPQTEMQTTIQTGSEIEDNNTYSSANEILPNETYRGSLSKNRNSEEDWYVFTIPETGAVTLHFNTPMQNDNDFYWNLVLNDASDPAPSSRSGHLWYTTLRGYDTDYLSVPLGLPAGTYYLQIYSSSSWSSDEYMLEVQYEVTNSWEIENNNMFKNASRVELNTVYNGVLQDNRNIETDWYVFTIPETGVATLHFNSPMQDDNDYYWNLILNTSADPTASRSDQIWYTTLRGFETDYAAAPIGLPAGTYYLQIYSSSSWSDDPYTLEIQYEASDTWEIERNETFKNATPIRLNTEYKGSLQNSRNSEEDWYVFKLDHSSAVTIRFNAPMQDGSDYFWKVSLRPGSNPTTTSSSEQLWSQGLRGYETSASSEVLQLDAGTYYLMIESGYGWSPEVYSLTVSG